MNCLRDIAEAKEQLVQSQLEFKEKQQMIADHKKNIEEMQEKVQHIKIGKSEIVAYCSEKYSALEKWVEGIYIIVLTDIELE